MTLDVHTNKKLLEEGFLIRFAESDFLILSVWLFVESFMMRILKKKARRMKVPIVWEEYLDECLRNKLHFDMYKVESALEASRDVVTVKVKGRSAIHKASDLSINRIML